MILIISPFFSPNVGGVETHLDDLCEYLDKRKVKTYVLTYSPITVAIDAPKYEHHGNLEIKRFIWPGYNLFHKFEKFHPVFNFLYLTTGLYLRSFFFLIKRHKEVEVFHSQGLAAGFVGVLLKKIFKKRLVVSTHSIYGLRKRTLFSAMASWVFNSADQVLALSQASGKELIEFGVEKNRLKVYTYWVNQKVFKTGNKNKARKILGINKNFVVLFVGRLIPRKGAGLLINIAKTETKINFVFVGTGPCEGEIKLAAKNFPNVIFSGRVENNKLPIYYQAADLLAVPSLYDEGLGRVILEGLSCGVPIIGSNLGGIPEVLNNKVGRLVSPNEESFHQAIKTLFKDRATLKTLFRACRPYALKRFSERNAELILKSYYE